MSNAPFPFPRRPILRSSFPWSSSALTEEQLGENSLLRTYMALVQRMSLILKIYSGVFAPRNHPPLLAAAIWKYRILLEWTEFIDDNSRSCIFENSTEESWIVLCFCDLYKLNLSDQGNEPSKGPHSNYSYWKTKQNKNCSLTLWN